MFTHEDLIKFYQLYLHYNVASNNIGVVDREKFNRLYKLIRKENQNNLNVRIILNEEHTKFTILENELEVTYILIQEPVDMRGRFFRKYI